MPAAADSQTELNEKAQRTVARIRAALDGGDSASIAQIVELIREVTYKFESISVQQLGEAVGRDLLTMSRVINVAHTLGYNPEGVEISTINQAIHVIGFDKIRNLALSLILMQNAATANAGDKRNVAASALASALVAQVIRERISPSDAEEAFVCTALRNYGRIMLANFLPDQYQEATARAGAGESESKVFRECFGLSPLELSAELLGRTRMPHNLMQGLREVSPSMRTNTGLSREQELAVLATFAEELCHLMDQPSLTAENFSEKALRLAQSFGPHIPLSEDELFDTLTQVSSTLNTFGALQIDNALNCPLLNRLQALAQKSMHFDGFGSRSEPMPPVDVDGTDDSPGNNHHDPLAEGVRSLIALDGNATATIEQVYAVALSAVHRGLDLDHTIVFRRKENSRRYVAWRGEGDFFAMINGEELLDAQVRDVFSVCLRRGEDVVIQNPADPKIHSFVPDWLRPVAGSHPMILLPVQDAAGTITVVCGLRSHDEHFVLTARQSQQLRALRQRIRSMEERLSQPGG